MSAQSVSAATAGVAAGETAILQRVQQLQALIESARQVANGGLVSTGGPPTTAPQSAGNDFASALQAATSADVASTQAPTVAGTATGVGYQPLQGAGTSGEGGEYEALIDQAAARNGLDPAVLHGLIQQESGFDPNATSSAGASGPDAADARHRVLARRRQPARPHGIDRRRGALPRRADGPVRRKRRRRPRRLQRRPRRGAAVRRRAALLRNPELRRESARRRRSLPPVARHWHDRDTGISVEPTLAAGAERAATQLRRAAGRRATGREALPEHARSNSRPGPQTRKARNRSTSEASGGEETGRTSPHARTGRRRSRRRRSRDQRCDAARIRRRQGPAATTTLSSSASTSTKREHRHSGRRGSGAAVASAAGKDLLAGSVDERSRRRARRPLPAPGGAGRDGRDAAPAGANASRAADGRLRCRDLCCRDELLRHCIQIRDELHCRELPRPARRRQARPPRAQALPRLRPERLAWLGLGHGRAGGVLGRDCGRRRQDSRPDGPGAPGQPSPARPSAARSSAASVDRWRRSCPDGVGPRAGTREHAVRAGARQRSGRAACARRRRSSTSACACRPPGGERERRRTGAAQR